ncbi:ubiquinone anaerobic biosynthesis accessory factor UbiT [Rheinheimera texasensis]|uniref:ubiquinone anaerobic biosynthesis accessory factor UbiT n=1 Tax=Rheinheimera texasensis TaxID=306205 RepID=UPI0012FF195B|nr:SCP2 sterol-binding domain-containing protein [Rheinheimera texasensis]
MKHRQYGLAMLRATEQRLPATIRTTVLKQALRQIFGRVAQQGTLDFLCGKRLSIEVPDLQLHYDLGLNAQRQFWLAAAGSSAEPCTGEVLFRANSNELLLLLSQQVDPDTLFFQRRLTIIGDTELGLQLKNFLDTLEPDNLLPTAIMLWLQEIAKTKQAPTQN